MALRFIRTREVCPSFPVGRRDEDWLLYSGAWQVGGRPADRPGDARGARRKERAPARRHGRQDTSRGGVRAWAAWAGIRPEGSEPPRWLLTIAYVPELEPSSDPESDWLLTSGGYHVGSVHRPLGPQNDPHWKLWVLGRRVAAGALRGAGLRRNRG